MEQANYKKIMLVSIGFLMIIFINQQAKAEFIFIEPVNLGPAVNTAYDEEGPCISADGLSLYFTRRDPFPDHKLLVSKRDDTESNWGAPQTVTLPFNRPDVILCEPCISADGLSLYLTGHQPEYDAKIWVTLRNDTNSAWNEPNMLGDSVNASSYTGAPGISSDNLELYFETNLINSRSGENIPSTNPRTNIWMTQRTNTNEQWGTPFNPFRTISMDYSYTQPCISSDGLTLIFCEGYSSLWIARRSGTSQLFPFDDPEKLPEPVNLEHAFNSFKSMHPSLSADGTLYFVSDRPGDFGGLDIWKTTSVPVVDFNGDENIDTYDLLILMDNWKTNENLCDIGPLPWGDGVVDFEDLKVFIEYWERENFPDVNVDEDDDGGQAVLRQGQILVVTLESNPSTGYSWAVVENQNSILEQQGGSEYKPSESETPMVGAGGWEIFRFKAVSAGQETLELIYRRPWETDAEPAKTFTTDIVVN